MPISIHVGNALFPRYVNRNTPGTECRDFKGFTRMRIRIHSLQQHRVVYGRRLRKRLPDERALDTPSPSGAWGVKTGAAEGRQKDRI